MNEQVKKTNKIGKETKRQHRNEQTSEKDKQDWKRNKKTTLK